MLPLPLVHRELLVATRRPAVYWARVAAAIGTVLFWVYALASGSFWKPTFSAGYEVFHALVHPIFLICLGIGAFTTSLSLFDEKRHGTLPLLLLTRIGPFGVVLGKLAAVSIYSGQILLGTLPVLASCFALGGVSGGEFVRTCVVLANTQFLSLAVGLMVAGVGRRAERVILGTLAVLAVVTVLPTLADNALQDRLHAIWPGTPFGFVTPGPWQTFSAIWDRFFRLDPVGFWQGILFQHLLGWVCLIEAAILTARAGGEVAGDRRWNGRPNAASEPAPGRSRSRPSARRNPVRWLSWRRWRPARLWVWLALVAVAWSLGLLVVGRSDGRVEFGYLIALPVGLHLVVAIALAAESAWRIAEARRSGEMELLLTTPVSDAMVSRGHAHSLLAQFGPAIALVGTVELGLAFFGDRFSRDHGDETVMRAMLLWAMLGNLLTSAPALVWVGLFQGVRHRRPLRGIFATLHRVVLWPLLGFVLTVVCLPRPWISRAGRDLDAGAWMLLVLEGWLVLVFALNVAWYHIGRRRVIHHLREIIDWRIHY